MSLSKLKILVVDEDERRGETLAEVLRISGFSVVSQVSSKDYLPRVVADCEPDLVLIDVASPDRDTLEQLSAIHRESPKPVVMFAQDEDEAAIEKAVRAGVSAYIVDGLTTAKVKPVIDVAIAHFNQHQALRSELDKAKTSLEERKFIDRAKGLLMEQRGLPEPDAYAMLRKLAMDRKKRLGQVARDIVEMADLLKPTQEPADTEVTETQTPTS